MTPSAQQHASLRWVLKVTLWLASCAASWRSVWSGVFVINVKLMTRFQRMKWPGLKRLNDMISISHRLKMGLAALIAIIQAIMVVWVYLNYYQLQPHDPDKEWKS